MSAHDEPGREHYEKGREAFSRRQHVEAETHFRAAFREAGHLPRGDWRRVWILIALAEVAMCRRDLALAETWYAQALDESDEGFGPDHMPTARIVNELGTLVLVRGDAAEGEAHALRILALTQKQDGLEARTLFASGLMLLGSSRQLQGRNPEADTLFGRSLEVCDSLSPPPLPLLPKVLMAFGRFLVGQHRSLEAEPLARRALVLSRFYRNPDHQLIAGCLAILGAAADERGNPDQAVLFFRQALDHLEQGGSAEEPQTAEVLVSLGNRLRFQGRLAEAEPLLRRAVTVLEKADPPAGGNVPLCLFNLAFLRWDQDDLVEAEQLLRRGLAIADQVGGQGKTLDSAVALRLLAWLCDQRGDVAEAVELLGRALDLLESSSDPPGEELPLVLARLAALRANAEDPEPSLARFRRALAVGEEILGPDHEEVRNLAADFVAFLNTIGRPAEANSLAQRFPDPEAPPSDAHPALSTAPADPADHGERMHDSRPVATAWAHLLLGTSCQQLGRLAEADLYLTRAIPSWEQQGEAGRQGLLDSLSLLCRVRHSQKRLAEAVSLGRRAFSVCREEFGEAHPRTGECAQWLGSLLVTCDQRPEAEELYRLALAIGERHGGTPDLVPVLCQLADLARARGAVGEAEAFARRGLGLREGAAGCLDVMQMAALLAEILRERREFDEAEPFYQRAITIARRLDGPEFISLALVQHNLGLMRHLQGRQPEAAELIEKALEIMEKAGPSAQPHKIIPHKSLGLVYFVMGRRTQADLCFQRFISLAEITYADNPPLLAQYLDKLAVLFGNIGRGRDANTLRARAAACRLRQSSP